MIPNCNQRSLRLEIGKHPFARLVAVQPVIRRARQLDACAFIHDVQLRQVMPLPDGKVVRIMRRRHLHRTGAELRVRPVVSDHRDLTANQRQHQHLANHPRITLVRGIHRNGDIAQHRLRPRSRNGDRSRPIGQRIANLIQLSRTLLVHHLKIAHSALQLRIPVHDVRAAVDQSLLPQANKGLAHSHIQAVVHGEVFAGPVHAVAKPGHLLRDSAAILAFPCPHALRKGLPTQVLPRGPTFGF